MSRRTQAYRSASDRLRDLERAEKELERAAKSGTGYALEQAARRHASAAKAALEKLGNLGQKALGTILQSLRVGGPRRSVHRDPGASELRQFLDALASAEEVKGEPTVARAKPTSQPGLGGASTGAGLTYTHDTADPDIDSPDPYGAGSRYGVRRKPPRPGERSPYGITILTPQSSNVYSFSYDPTTQTLFVTFKANNYHKGALEFGAARRRGGSRQLHGRAGATIKGGPRPNRAGPIYAYHRVPITIYHAMQSAASKGKFVWDALRIRGTLYGHKYRYNLVSGDQVPSGGTYIPRLATKKGFAERATPNFGAGRRGFTSSTLAGSKYRQTIQGASKRRRFR